MAQVVDIFEQQLKKHSRGVCFVCPWVQLLGNQHGSFTKYSRIVFVNGNDRQRK